MYNWITVVIFKLLSLLQATTLRERYYTALDRIDTLEIAIKDIERISTSRVESSERHRLIKGICERVKGE